MVRLFIRSWRLLYGFSFGGRNGLRLFTIIPDLLYELPALLDNNKITV
jgi:hypothetical protein